jgi:hypothetical protein
VRTAHHGRRLSSGTRSGRPWEGALRSRGVEQGISFVVGRGEVYRSSEEADKRRGSPGITPVEVRPEASF